MPTDDPGSARTLTAGELVGSFRVEQLLETNGDVRRYRARDEHVDRVVVLHVAGGLSSAALLDDARRIGAIAHVGLVAVLEAGRFEDGAYAAVADARAVPISRDAALSPREAARVAIDVSQAIAALAESGLRAPVDATTVLVAKGTDGVHGLLDPLRALGSVDSSLSAADARASTTELADLVESAVPASSAEFRDALGGVRSHALSGPAELAVALAPLVASPRHARSHRVPLMIASAALLVIAAIVVALVAHGRSGGSSRPVAVAARPAARIVARIPLGIGANDYAGGYAVVGDSVWIATSSGHLLRVDTATNRVVGSPIDLGRAHPLWNVIGSGGSLFTTDSAGWLLRIDPHSGRITGKRHFAGHLTGLDGANGVIWAALDEGRLVPKTGSAQAWKSLRGVVVRVDARSMKTIGKPLPALPNPSKLIVRGSLAWVTGSFENEPEVVRIDIRSSTRRLIHTGPQLTGATLGNGVLWVADRISGSVSALDASTMEFTGPTVQTPHSAYGIVTAGSDLWVAATASLGGGVSRIERYDAHSGRHAGTPVTLGDGAFGLRLGRGALWALTDRTLIRLAPTAPRPALARAAPADTSPRPEHNGPLERGTWRTTRFAVPLEVTTPAYAWFDPGPEPDWVSLESTPAGLGGAELDIVAPTQMFANDTGKTEPVGSPASILKVLRANPHLAVSALHHVTIDHHDALQFTMRAKHPQLRIDVCGPDPCVLVFPVHDNTFGAQDIGLSKVSLLRVSGHTLVVFESANPGAKRGFAAVEALLRTVHFTS